MNLGNASVNFSIRGIENAISQLARAEELFRLSAKAADESTKFNRAFVQVMKQEYPAVKEAVGAAYSYATAQQRITDTLIKQIGVKERLLALNNHLQRVYTATGTGGYDQFSTKRRLQEGLGNVTSNFGALPGSKPFSQAQATAISNSMMAMQKAFGSNALSATMTAINTAFSRLASIGPKVSSAFAIAGSKANGFAASVRGLVNSFKFANTAQQKNKTVTDANTRAYQRASGGARSFTQNLGTAVKRLSNLTTIQDSWWKRFGQVAGGFWIAYRAINAIEIAISKMTRTFASGVQMMDEYKSGVAVVSGMLALLSEGGKGFKDRFNSIKEVMKDTMRESMRLAPAFQLSMDEISEGYKELAQFGVVVTKDMTEKTLTSIAMIREIAYTTGSSSRQLRQEIQSLFNGQTRVTDQFGRFLKRMPEFKDALYGIARANTTNAEKWQMVIDKMYEFRFAIYESVQTVTGQLQVATNSLKVISGMAAENSDVYGSWVLWLINFNRQLFKADGTLGNLGKRIYEIFYRMWQWLFRIPLIFGDIKSLIGEWLADITPLIQKHKDIFIVAGKMFVLVTLLRTAWGAIFGLAQLLLSPLTNALKLMGQIVAAGFKFLSAISASNLGLLGVLAKVSFITTGLLAWWPIFTGIGNMISDLIDMLADFGSDIWDILFNPDKFEEKRKEMGNKWKEYNWIDSFLKGYREGTDDVLNAVKETGARVMDDVMAITNMEFNNLMAWAKEKLPNLFKEFGNINYGDLSEDAKKKLKALQDYVFNDGGVGKDPVEKSLAKWLKIIEDLNAELRKAPMNEFQRKAEDVGTFFSKMSIDLDEALKKIPELKKYETEIRSLMAQVAVQRKKEIGAESALFEIAKQRYAVEQKMRDVKRQYENYKLTTKESVQAELDINKELLRVYQAELQILLNKPNRDDSAILQKKNEITELEDKINDVTISLAKLNRTFGQSVADGFKAYIRSVEDFAGAFQQGATDIATSLQDAFSSLFFDWMKGELKSLTDYWNAFLENVYKIIADIATKMIVSGLVQGGLSALGIPYGGGAATTGVAGGTGVSASYGGFTTSGGYSVGGNLIPNYSATAFADGGWLKEPILGMGMTTGKTYTLAEKGPEYVSPEDQVGGGGGDVNVQVNMINQSGQDIGAKQQSTRFDGSKYVIDVILEDVSKNGRLRPLFKGR